MAHLVVPSISSLAEIIQRRVAELRDSLSVHCLQARAESLSSTLGTRRLLLHMASSYMDERLPGQLDQILRIAAAHSDEILEAAYDWTLSTDEDLRSMVLQVIDCLDSRSPSVPQPRSPSSHDSSPQSELLTRTSTTSGPSSPSSRSSRSWASEASATPTSSPSLPDTSTTSGASSSSSPPVTSSCPPPQLCQVSHEPPELAHPVSDELLDSSHVLSPGGVEEHTLPEPGLRSSGADHSLRYPPFLGNHREAGGKGLHRDDATHDMPVDFILSEKEGRFNQTQTREVELNTALSHEEPKAQPPPLTLRGTSSRTILPNRRHLMPALVLTLTRRPRRIHRPQVLKALPCTPSAILKMICKRIKGKPPETLLISSLELTDVVKLRRRRRSTMTRPDLACSRCLHGPVPPPAPPWDHRCSPHSGCADHHTQASQGNLKPVPPALGKIPPGHHLGTQDSPSNQIHLIPSSAAQRDDTAGLYQPRKWPYVPVPSRPFPPNPGVNRRCRTCSWPLSPSHPGLPHVGQLHRPHDPGGHDDHAPGDLDLPRDPHPDVLIPLSQHHGAHDVPDLGQGFSWCSQCTSDPSLVRGFSKDDLSQATPPHPASLTSPGSRSDTCGRGHLGIPTCTAYKPQDTQEQIIQGPPSKERRHTVNHLALNFMYLAVIVPIPEPDPHRSPAMADVLSPDFPF